MVFEELNEIDLYSNFFQFHFHFNRVHKNLNLHKTFAIRLFHAFISIVLFAFIFRFYKSYNLTFLSELPNIFLPLFERARQLTQFSAANVKHFDDGDC